MTARALTDAAALTSFLHQSIPLTAAMALELESCETDHVELKLPLEPNRNDKGCAFGGSLASAMTLAGWSLATLSLARAGLSGEVFVAESGLRYLLPVWSDCLACARLSDPAALPRAMTQLRRRGRARLQMLAEIRLPDGRTAASMQASYALLAPGQARRD